MSAEYWLSTNLRETFRLPEDAVEWTLALWRVIQAFDDFADGDPVSRETLNETIFDTLVNMPGNDFFLRHHSTLLPLLAVQILKWKASDTAERAGEADVVSFVWRAGFYDIVLAVIQLSHGQEIALDACHLVMKLYGEDFPSYCEEFDHA